MLLLLLEISSGTLLILLYENSLGLVIYQLMSKEELPISGDRWSELRKGEVIDRYRRYLQNKCKELEKKGSVEQCA